MKISQTGLILIKHYESLHDGDLTQIGLQPKMDPLGIWTVGYGHSLTDAKGSFIKGIKNKDLAYSMFPNLTEEQSSDMLDEDMNDYETDVNNLNLALNQNQFDSLVSFTYNVGIGNLQTSTLLKRVKDKSGPGLITEAFSRFNKGKDETGKLVELKGLTFRRWSEALLFNTGELKFYN